MSNMWNVFGAESNIPHMKTPGKTSMPASGSLMVSRDEMKKMVQANTKIVRDVHVIKGKHVPHISRYDILNPQHSEHIDSFHTTTTGRACH